MLPLSTMESSSFCRSVKNQVNFNHSCPLFLAVKTLDASFLLFEYNMTSADIFSFIQNTRSLGVPPGPNFSILEASIRNNSHSHQKNHSSACSWGCYHLSPSPHAIPGVQDVANFAYSGGPDLGAELTVETVVLLQYSVVVTSRL